MTGNESIFHSQVKMENDALVQAKGKGSIGVQIKRRVRYILDVLLVWEFGQNLFSVSQLVENDYSLKFE